MKTLLRIDASLRTNGSHSKALSDFFEKKWKIANPEGRVICRDLSQDQIPHLQNNTVESFHVPEGELTAENERALALSNQLIAELKSVDELLISSPMYNLNVPSSLKAYFDHIIRFGHTFAMNPNGSFSGLLSAQSVYIITAKGGINKGTSLGAIDFQEQYLKAICGFLGIGVKKVFPLEGTANPNLVEQNIEYVQQEISQTFELN